MCRLYGFRANERTKVECTLVYAQNALLSQSRADLKGKSHGDGWGIGFYEEDSPILERRHTAAFDDLHFSATAERVFARNIVAHVRRATVGEISPQNTHPFTWDRWTFAHNGTVIGFESLEEKMLGESEARFRELRRGRTDSEVYFYWLLSRLTAAGIDLLQPIEDAEALAAVVADAVGALARRCEAADPRWAPKLNLLLTDGDALVAVRWNRNLNWVGREGIHDCEICGIPHIRHQPGVEYRAVVVASEPISDEPWQQVPNCSVLWVDRQIRHGLLPIDTTGVQHR